LAPPGGRWRAPGPARQEPTGDVSINQIRDYVVHRNTNPQPFTWAATADKILVKVRLVQTNIKKLVDNNAK
jgi:hypothetical protein